MHVATAMTLLLCCGVVASAAAVNNDVALAGDDAALNDDATSLPTRLEAALKRRASEPDAATLEKREDITNRMLLEAINNAFARQGTPNSSDNCGPLPQLLLSQISERVRVLEAQATADAQTLQTLSRQLEQATQDGSGASTFVRWGSSTCGAGNASSLVYSGVVGGSTYAHSGSAVNYLCLTLSPRFSTRTPPTPHVALLYGAEYETYDSHTKDLDPVCAVCRAAFSTTVMIPGTDTCTPGWRLQYSGFLMAGMYTHKAATEYICVDHALESAHRSDSNNQGAELFFTKTVCGSLPCAPYLNDKVVMCAVCSK